jgi:hypothetical protein
MEGSIAASGIFRKLSFHVVLGKSVVDHLNAPRAQAMLAVARNAKTPYDLVMQLRKSPSTPSNLYPTFCKFDSPAGPTSLPMLLDIRHHEGHLSDTLDGGTYRGAEIEYQISVNQSEVKERKIFALSATLRSIPDEALQEPFALIDWLTANRPRITEEVYGSTTQLYGYTNLVNALAGKGLLKDSESLLRYAKAIDLYGPASSLANCPSECVADPTKLIDWLIAIRPQVEKKTNGKVSYTSQVRFLLGTNRIPREPNFIRLLEIVNIFEPRSIHNASATLRGIPPLILTDAVATVNWLTAYRATILKEIGAPQVRIGAFIHALAIAGKLVLSELTYHYIAYGKEIFENSPTLQSIPKNILADPIETVHWLHNNRATVNRELKRKEGFTLDLLVSALQAGGLITDNQLYERFAHGLDLYLASPILQAIPSKILSDPITVTNWLQERRDDISNEVGAAAPYSATTLFMALQAARVIDIDSRWMPGARDYYDNCADLHIEFDPTATVNDVILFLDRIREKLVRFDGLEGRVSYSYAVNALIVAEKVPNGISFQALRYEAAAADYARKHEELITRELLFALNIYFSGKPQAFAFSFDPVKNKHWRTHIDHAKFRSLQEDNVQLSDGYISSIVNHALRFYGFAAVYAELEKLKKGQGDTKVGGKNDYYINHPILYQGPAKWESLSEALIFIDSIIGSFDPSEEGGIPTYRFLVDVLIAAGRIPPPDDPYNYRTQAETAEFARRFEIELTPIVVQAIQKYNGVKKGRVFDPNRPTNWRSHIDQAAYAAVVTPHKQESKFRGFYITQYALLLYGYAAYQATSSSGT